MNVEVQELEPCRQVLKVIATAEETGEAYRGIVEQFAGGGRVPGFRKGKAPVAVIEKRFKDQISEEVRSVLVPKLYREALKEKGITPVSVVDVSAAEFSRETGISFAVTVDVAPDFKLPKYKKIPVKREEVSVSDEDVAQSVEQMRSAYAQYEDDNEKAVEDGDMVQVDYRGTIDGQPIADMAGDCSNLGEATDFWTQCGEPEFLPGMIKALAGMRVGEDKQVTVKFPKDFRVAEVHGKKAVYDLKVKAIRLRQLPELDEEFCKRLGADNAEALTQQIREHMQSSAEQNEQNRQREEVSQFLLKKTVFELPQSVVEQERQLTVRSMVQQFMQRGATREQLQEQQGEIMQRAGQMSLDRVKLGYILSRIADEEKLEVSDELFKERAEATAAQHRMAPAEFLAELEKNNGTERLMSDIRSGLTMDFLLSEAKIK